MKNKNGEEILVFMDDDANYCVIVGTEDFEEAEKALREAEEEWYGEDHEEKPIPIEEFYMADVMRGEKNGETYYYWGHEPLNHFDDGNVEIVKALIAHLE